ncbi:HAMP domain-containing sensor histidine kinase [Actinokineospora sp. UTMC 2448]|uniref:sensor histidine kinase n=1 Tax=Actinokineospora sp. UTMC 2448 TaxID=2268449 RepID=UPI0021645993|nr:HAMP domain-containing sensor histidine kinase [Actinokineospora sp. UTMC 2448]UVS79206.1 Sensor histidine kinase MtrB [Actinokineospora sp. UTMC 2448]
MTVMLITVAASIAVAALSYQMQSGPAWDRFAASALAGFRSDAQQAARHFGAPGSSKVERIADFMEGRLGVAWAVVDLRGATAADGVRYTAAAGSPGHPGDLRVDEIDIARQGLDPVTYTADDGPRAWFAVAGTVSPDIVLVEFYNRDKIDRELAWLRTRLVVVASVVSVAAALIGVLAAGLVQRPVRVAAAAARRFGAGELDVRVPVRGSDELADLAGSFNSMAARLGDSIAALRAKERQQRRFIADVAHDLRTPLASMLAAAESLDSAYPGDRERSAHLVTAQARRLSALVDDLLEMSLLDAGAADYRPEPVDLPALTADAAALAAPDQSVTVTTSGDATVVGDPRRLHTIMRNLLSNAARHGAPPITVTIDGRDPTQVSITVTDAGPGLPADLLPVVFDRFVRGDRARTGSEGSGLGLAIARENAALHNGTLRAAGGSTFILTLPRGTPPD